MWNKKEVHQLDTGYNMWPWPLTLLMTLTLDVSRSNLEIALSQELFVWLMWNENTVSWCDTGLIVWLCPLTTPMTLTLGVEISRSESEMALSQDWDGRLTWNEKDMSYPFMTMILTSLTMVGWADVPDSDLGDFRRRRAINISSWCIVSFARWRFLRKCSRYLCLIWVWIVPIQDNNWISQGWMS